MPRCSVCDTEYISGEITCKMCDTDLPQDVDPPPEPEGRPTLGDDIFDPFRETMPGRGSRGEEPKDSPSGIGPSVPVVPIPEQPPVVEPSTPPIPSPPVSEEPLKPEPPGPPVASTLCPKCGAAIDKTSQFCDSCGALLGKSCPGCGAENKAGAKFCFKCGNIFQKVGPGTDPPQPRPEGNLNLVILGRDGRVAGKFVLREGENRVGVKAEGSFPDVDLTSVDLDEAISRKHAVLVVRSGMVSVYDMGSLNGTKVDGTAVTKTPVELGDNSDLVFANIRCRISRS